MRTLVDANVLIDVATGAARWSPWSEAALAAAADEGELVINAVVDAEIAHAYRRIEELEAAIPAALFAREPIPFEAAFLAAKAHGAYRRRGGVRTTTLPDFFIGAHAAVRGYRLLTRDGRRYATAFPTLRLIAP